MNNYIMALFASGTTNFDYAGMGALKDAFSAVATETATSNGNITYTMEMTYPVNGYLADKLVEGNLIKAQVSKTPGDYMIFEINETLKSDDTTITVYCDAYANRILRMSFDNGGKFGSFGNVQQALNAARAQMTGIQSDFTLSSGIGTSLNMSGVTSKNTLPTTYQDFNAYLDAIMDKVQGNVRFGINSIQIVSDRGRDITDTVLRDDKNTNGISIKVDTSNIVNRIIPMLPVRDKSGNITQETKVGKIVTSSVAFKFINFYAGQVVSVDTQDLANSYFNRTNCDRPTTTATVQTSMLDEDLTDIRLFDRVQVYSSKIGYQAKLRVCERDFDILAGAVSEFKLGSSSVTVFNSQTSVINAVNSAVQSAQYAAITADGKNTAYYEGANPDNPKENDLWFHTVNGVSQIDQYINGNWVTIVSDSTGAEINKKVDQMGLEAKSAVDQAKAASDKADQIASKFDDTDKKADQALENSISAQSDAASAVAKAESTASGFGKLDQKADSALSAALNAQTNANTAVSQASSAAADSKDAKQIAGAVSQSYKTLTDGSTMTIAELENGLATKLTKTDLDGYATQTWTQNQIKVTADGINATMSSIKSTVDGQTTSINDLKADSSSFKSQFTTVNNTLGKQATDISTLQATSKELTSGFNTLTTDNATNKNDISQLRQTATELNSTMMTVQTQVQNSAVGTNLLLNTGDDNDASNPVKMLVGNFSVNGHFTRTPEYSQVLPDMNSSEMNYRFGDSSAAELHGLEPGKTYTLQGEAFINNGQLRFRSQRTTTGGWADYDGSISGVLAKNTEDFVKVSYTFTVPSGATAVFISWQIYNYDSTTIFRFRKMKLEKGSVATDFSVNPEDTATVSAFSKLSQTVDGMQLDISKKLEQKDLNGYATQTWTQNQIKLTSDSLSATLSSVKSTVDGHTTSINSLQADSSGFKAQFTTVNNTLGKQTTDISTLQSTTKSLSASFDSLKADNATNMHDISQLQLTSNSFSTTLESVQQKVEDGLISTNIFRSANDFSRSYWTDPLGYQFTTFQAESRYHDSLIHYQGQGKTPEPYSTIAQQTITDDAMSADTWYTLSFYARGAGDNNSIGKFAVYFYGNGSDQSMSSSDGVEVLGTSDTHCIITLTPYFRRYVITFHTPKDFSGGHSFWARNDPDLNDGSLYCDFWHPKLELGKVASDFSVNPADTATISALSSISQTVDSIQTTVRGKVDNSTYQSKMTQIDNAIVTKVTKGDVTNDNILPYSGYWSDTTGWTLFPWGASDKTLSLAHHNFYHNAVDATLFIQTAQNATAPVGSSKFTLIPNTTYTFSFWGFASSNVVGTNVYLLGRSYTSTKDYDFVHALFENLKMSPSGINKYTATFTTGPTETQAYIRLDNGGSNNGQSAGSYFAELKLEQGNIATPYTRVSSGEVQITSDNINLKVSKDGVVSAINISPESITIDGKRLHITAATYIDNAVIKDAMIANLSASKLTAGSINAANINVYNLNGANIVSNSITADKLQAGAMLIAMNSTLQTLKIGTDGLYTTNASGTSIGKIHANNLVQHPENWGLDMDLSSTGQYMAWGAQNEGDPTGGYVIKFGWTRSSAASDFGMPWGGFWFNDNVMLHKNLRFDGGGIDVAGAYQLMKFAWISMNGTKYPFFGSSDLKAGWLFGSNETYLVRGDGVINASKILGVLNGQKYKFIKELNSNGSVKY